MTAARPRSEGRDLRVATFNVRAAIGPGPFPDRWWRRCDPARLERIATVIRGLHADVVALQEVALMTLDGVVTDQASELGRLTGMASRYAATRTFAADEEGRLAGAGTFGNALLTRLPVLEARTLALPRADEEAMIEPSEAEHRYAGVRYADAPPTVREPRCALLAQLELPDGRTLRVGSTHFSHVGSGERLLQARALDAGFGDTSPALLLGDLNAAIGSDELAPLCQGWTDAFAAVGLAPDDPARRSTDDGWPIDQVLVRGLEVVECSVRTDAGDASDHYPLLATLRA